MKDDREVILDVIKRGVIQLTKIRHPRILTVQHPLEESRDTIAFVTEPIIASLSNYMGNYTNMPSATESSATQFPPLHEIEVKYGLLQLMEGLQFLHSDMKMIHRNVCPESIVINAENNWKIAGFEYCCVLTMDETGQISGNQQPSFIPNSKHGMLQPSLDWAAPEWILDMQQFYASDIYSFGMHQRAIASYGYI